MKNITITNKTKELIIKQTITEKYIDDNGHELVNCGIFNRDSGKYEFIYVTGINDILNLHNNIKFLETNKLLENYKEKE